MKNEILLSPPLISVELSQEMSMLSRFLSAEVLLALVDTGGCAGRMPLFKPIFFLVFFFLFVFLYPRVVLGAKHEGQRMTPLCCSDYTT